MKLLFSLLLFPLVGFCSDAGEDSIGFSILEKEVRLKPKDSSFDITAILSNSSTQNVLLYAFRRGFMASSADSVFLNIESQHGAGNALILLDLDGNRQPLSFDDCDDCVEAGPTSHQDNFLTILKDSVKRDYLKTTEIINSRGRSEIKFEIKTNNIRLPKGKYQFYMIYYCGQFINQIIDESTISDNEKIYGATTFRGWVKSNCVTLVVE